MCDYSNCRPWRIDIVVNIYEIFRAHATYILREFSIRFSNPINCNDSYFFDYLRSLTQTFSKNFVLLGILTWKRHYVVGNKWYLLQCSKYVPLTILTILFKNSCNLKPCLCFSFAFVSSSCVIESVLNIENSKDENPL